MQSIPGSVESRDTVDSNTPCDGTTEELLQSSPLSAAISRPPPLSGSPSEPDDI